MKEKFRYIVDLFISKEMGILPSGLAFSIFFAIIPILSIIFYLITSFNFSMDALQSFMEQTFPLGVVKLLEPVFIEDLSITSIIIMATGLIVIINGCMSIIISCNTIYGISNAPYYKRLMKSLLLSFIMIFLLAFILIVPLLGNVIIKLLGNFGNLISKNEILINVIYLTLRFPVSLLVMFLLIKFIYLIAPDQKTNSKFANKGAIFTTIAWLVLTIIYSYYINNIARYDLIYGNLANIIILMFWIYLLAYAFVIGIVINRDVREYSVDKTNTIKLEEIRKKIKEKN